MLRLTLLLLATIYLAACAAPNTVKVNYDSAEVLAEAALQRELALNKILSYKNRLNTVSYRSLKPLQSFAPPKDPIPWVLADPPVATTKMPGEPQPIKFLVVINIL